MSTIVASGRNGVRTKAGIPCEPEIKPHGNTRQTFGRAIRSALWRHAVHGETDQWARFLRLPSRRVCVDIESNVAEAGENGGLLGFDKLDVEVKVALRPFKDEWKPLIIVVTKYIAKDNLYNNMKVNIAATYLRHLSVV